jgi:hypothetical protein
MGWLHTAQDHVVRRTFAQCCVTHRPTVALETTAVLTLVRSVGDRAGRLQHRACLTQRQRSDTGRSSRPMSMIQTYQPPIMEVGQDTLPELQRIFMFLNSHSNKLYQEGYFLKFHDTDTRTSGLLGYTLLWH